MTSAILFGFVLMQQAFAGPEGAMQQVRHKLVLLADSLSKQHDLHEYEPCSLFDDSATIAELHILSDHVSPAVRYYSLRALARRGDSSSLPVFVHHLSDTSRIVVGAGDVWGQGPLGWYVANELLDIYFRSSPTSCFQYLSVRSLAIDTVVSSAVLGLARYQKAEDVPLLRNRIEHMMFVERIPPGGRPYYPYYALATIREFPHPAFFSVLKRAVHMCQSPSAIGFNRVFVQAVVKFKNRDACDFLSKMLREAKGDGVWLTKVAVVAALLRYPDAVFHSIERDLTLDLGSYRIAQRWAMEEW